jgi:hypothetical protein
MSITTTQFAGHEAIRIESGRMALMITTSVGPRVLGLLTEDGRNHLVELPGMTLDCPGSGPFHMRGGSRLWAAPEDARVTYRPDDEPVGVEELDDGVRLVTRPDPVAGTSRQIAIRVTGPERCAFDYRVVNRSDRRQRLAAWSITMLQPLGRAFLPVLTEPFDEGGLQGQRNIVLWPYSRNDDPRYVVTFFLFYDCTFFIKFCKISQISTMYKNWNSIIFKMGSNLMYCFFDRSVSISSLIIEIHNKTFYIVLIFFKILYVITQILRNYKFRIQFFFSKITHARIYYFSIVLG